MVKPIKSLELHYPMIQFLIITVRLDRTCNGMEADTGISLSFMLVSSATVRIRIFRLVNVMDPYWLKFHYCVELSLKAFINEETLLSNHCFLKWVLVREMTKHLPEK